jgi:hypothetical protein
VRLWFQVLDGLCHLLIRSARSEHYSHQSIAWAGVRCSMITPVLSCSEGLSVFPAPEVAEGPAIQNALSLLLEHGFQKVVLASDCLWMVQRISSQSQDRSPAGAVVRDIKLLATKFWSCIFKHVCRNSNVVAHVLAHSSDH